MQLACKCGHQWTSNSKARLVQCSQCKGYVRNPDAVLMITTKGLARLNDSKAPTIPIPTPTQSPYGEALQLNHCENRVAADILDHLPVTLLKRMEWQQTLMAGGSSMPIDKLVGIALSLQ